MITSIHGGDDMPVRWKFLGASMLIVLGATASGYFAWESALIFGYEPRRLFPDAFVTGCLIVQAIGFAGLLLLHRRCENGLPKFLRICVHVVAVTCLIGTTLVASGFASMHYRFR